MARRRTGLPLLGRQLGLLLVILLLLLGQPLLVELPERSELLSATGLVGLLFSLLDLVSLQLFLPPVRYCHADDPTDVLPAGSSADATAVAAGMAGSGTRCRYVHIPLTYPTLPNASSASCT